MDDLQKRFINLRIEILKVTIILTFVLTFLFCVFHIYFYNGSHKYDIVFSDFAILFVSFLTYKYINEENYKIFAVIEFLVILLSIVILSIFYPTNLFLPIWMFGTIIVFVLCTNIKMGVLFLITTIIVFDILYLNKLDFYSFITLNMQFIAYFILGLILINKLSNLQKKTYLYEKMLYESSIKDPLTNIYNRKYFEKTAKLLMAKAKRNNKKIMFLIIDIDHFKQINDTYGHPIGDIVLKSVANTLQSNLRQSDLFARIGGEEFAILIDDYNEKSLQVAEKLRKAIEKLKIHIDNQVINVTISIGGVVSQIYNYEYLYKRADSALYEAKKKRNTTVIYIE